MLGTLVNRSTLAAGAVTLALLAGAVGLADSTAPDCLTAVSVPANTIGQIRTKVRPAQAIRVSAPATGGGLHTRGKNGRVNVTVADRPTTTGDMRPRTRTRHANASTAGRSVPADANRDCA